MYLMPNGLSFLNVLLEYKAVERSHFATTKE